MASSLLKILVPATVTVKITNFSIPLVLDALRLANVTDDELAPIVASANNGSLSFLNSFYYAMDELQSFIAVPPGVQQGFVVIKSWLLPCYS